MDLELNFTKGDNDVWGFRIVGGAEYDVPFTIVNVTEHGISEIGGLKVGDIITSVNGSPAVGLIHNDAHDLLLKAGNSLTLGILRESIHLAERVECEDENNKEVSNILNTTLENEDTFNYQKETHFEIINPEESADLNSENHQSQETNGHASNERKWSTFLQKPSNPKPVLKKTEEDVPKGAPYRVIIKKQPKKGTQEKCDLEDDNNNYEIDTSNEVPIDNPEPFEEFELSEDPKEEVDEENEVLEAEEEEQEVEPKSEKNVLLEKMLEEKLAEVQKQLEALSKLPSTIQTTIEAVTKQIATIVQVATTVETVEEEVMYSGSNSDAEKEISEDREIPDEKFDEEMEVEKVEIEGDEGELNEESVKEEDNIEMVEEPQLTEEDIEANRIAQELLEKQKKELELIEEFKQRRLKQKPTLPLKPIERPIILPGGRRWSQPDDACPTVKDKKMSDEKIADTIETYSETIIGKTKGYESANSFILKGPCLQVNHWNQIWPWSDEKKSFYSINFMKYQPPPKNLDYLQRSDVYKLVHDMEPPVRGISSRVSKVLSEQDYYQVNAQVHEL